MGVPEPENVEPRRARRAQAWFGSLPRWLKAALLAAGLFAVLLPLNALRHYAVTGSRLAELAVAQGHTKRMSPPGAWTEEGHALVVAGRPAPVPLPRMLGRGVGGITSGVESSEERYAAPSATPSEQPVAAVQLASTGWDRLIIRNASVSFTVRDINEAQHRIVQIADLLGGYIAGANIQQPEKTGQHKPPATGTIELRVPNERFNEALAELRKIGRKTAINITSQDVCEEYVDLQSRLRHWRAQERLVLEMLNRASKISDMLAVRNALAEIQEQMETITGRLRYLSARVSMASISVTISEKAAKPKPKKPALIGKIKSDGKRLKTAFRKSIEDFVVAVAWIGVIAINVVWYVLLAAIAFLIYRRFAPRRPVAQTSSRPPSPLS